LFAGVGGFHLGMSQSGHQCVGACEIDKYARSIYAKHFPKVRVWEDATKINPKELPDFECLTAGFPCQSFSIAGARRGFEDTRGSLFFEIARIAKEKRPRYLLLENVKGLLNHDSGKTFRVIISTLDEMGYDAEWQVLNSKYFVPQNRERVFIIGHLRGVSGRKIFPLGEDNKKIVEPRLNQLNKTFHDTGRIYHPDGIARSLRANSGGMGSKTGLYAVENNIKKIGNKNPSGIGQSGNVYDINGIAPTLCSSDATRGFNSSGYVAVTKDHGKLRQTKDQSLAIDANYWKGADNHGQRTLIHVIGSTQNHAAHKINESTSLTEAMGKGGGHVPMIYMAHSKGNIKQRIQDRKNVWTITDNARDFGILAWSKSTRDWGVEERIKLGEANTLSTSEGCRNQSSANYVFTPKYKQLDSSGKNYKSQNDRIYDINFIGPTIPVTSTGSKLKIEDGTRIRRLTPKECERLQGFEDDYTKYDKDGEIVSDTQRYRCCGNAVTVAVVKYVAENLI